MRILLAALAAVVLAAPPPAFAAGDAAFGRDLAVTWCSSCHLTDGGGASRDDIRPMQMLARDPAVTPERLRAFLVKPHGRMPELILTAQEIEHLIAYIQSLK